MFGRRKKTPSKPLRSESVRAVIRYDDMADCPFDDWDTFGSLVICDPRRGGGSRALSVSDLEDFCNQKFDPDEMLACVYGTDAYSVAKWIRNYGALTSEVDGGFVVAGHDQIVAEYGYDNPQSRRKAQERIDEEARIYSQWADGDVYCYSVYDNHSLDGSELDRIIEDERDFRSEPDDELVDSCCGYYSFDDARNDAEASVRDYLRRTEGREPCFAPKKGGRR